MNGRQNAALRLLNDDLRRDLYEGSDGGRDGCGRYWITYSAGIQYEPLTRGDIDGLLNTGMIRRRWKDYDGCFILTT